jgi:hypothetical protein
MSPMGLALHKNVDDDSDDESILFSSIPLKQHTEGHTSFRQVGNQSKLCD